MTPVELSILIVSVIVALAVPWNAGPDAWKPSGYSLLRWFLSVILVFMLCFIWLRH